MFKKETVLSLSKPIVFLLETNTSIPLEHAVLSLQEPVCKLKGVVTWEVYASIEAEEGFSLTPDFRSPMSSGMMVVGRPVELEVVLIPSLFQHVVNEGTTIEAVASELEQAHQQSSTHYLVNASNNWVCTAVQQQREGQAIGYKTVWSYAAFDTYQTEADLDGIINQASVQFIQEQIKAGHNPMIEDATGLQDKLLESGFFTKDNVPSEEELTHMANAFEELIGGSPNKLNDMFKDILNQKVGEKPEELESLMNMFGQDFSDEEEEFDEEEFEYQSILEVVAEFFEDEEWEYTINEAEDIIYVTHEWEVQNFQCIGKIFEEDGYFIFYTIYPKPIPNYQHFIMIEVINRLNALIKYGSFELDVETGSLRCRTSVDVSDMGMLFNLAANTILESTLLMELAYPIFRRVLGSNMSPKKAAEKWKAVYGAF